MKKQKLNLLKRTVCFLMGFIPCFTCFVVYADEVNYPEPLTPIHNEGDVLSLYSSSFKKNGLNKKPVDGRYVITASERQILEVKDTDKNSQLRLDFSGMDISEQTHFHVDVYAVDQDQFTFNMRNGSASTMMGPTTFINKVPKGQWISYDFALKELDGYDSFELTNLGRLFIGSRHANFKGTYYFDNLYFYKVEEVEPEVDAIRVLSIGNSFSEDAVENYLYDLGQAEETNFIIGNMCIDGASLENHWNNANEDLGVYSYRKIGIAGEKTINLNMKLSQVFSDEKWDYVVFQQDSKNSGVYDSYFPYLNNLLNYAKEKSINTNTKYGLHLTWAYAQAYTNESFEIYNRNQLEMYTAIVDAVNRVAQSENIDIVIPVGTAIQNARTSFLGDNLNRDNLHLDKSIGRYTAACTWYEILTGKSVVKNLYAPGNMTPIMIEIAQNAAHNAVSAPKNVTDMSIDYVLPDSELFELEAPVNIDFGSILTETPWNNMCMFEVGAYIHGMLNMDGEITPFKIENRTTFGGVNIDNSGNSLTISDWQLPAKATSDSFWGNAGEPIDGTVVESGMFSVSGLNSQKCYDFVMFSSCTASDYREVSFKVVGENEGIAHVNSSGNTTKQVVVESIVPDIDGTVKIVVGAGPDNDNANKMYYINALQIRQNNKMITSCDGVNVVTIRAYPNPALDDIKIYGLNPNVVYEYQVVGIDGRIVQMGIYDNDNIDISYLRPSCYVIVLENKITKERLQFSFIKGKYK